MAVDRFNAVRTGTASDDPTRRRPRGEPRTIEDLGLLDAPPFAYGRLRTRPGAVV